MTESWWTMLLSGEVVSHLRPIPRTRPATAAGLHPESEHLQSTFKQNLQDGLTVTGNSTVRGSSTIYITQTFHCRVAREPVKSRVSEVFNLVETR